MTNSAVPAHLIQEVALWCSLQALTSTHQDTPGETHRRQLLAEAGELLKTAKYSSNAWLRKLLPAGRRWTRAMELIAEADPDSLNPLAHQLRSAALKPAESPKGLDSDQALQAIVNRVIEHRSTLVQSHFGNERLGTIDRASGRLLVYVPCDNLFDGASQYYSKGFFDVYDCPPWDIWVHCDDGVLTSWVPEVLLPLAQAGIDANPVECIRWAE